MKAWRGLILPIALAAAGPPPGASSCSGCHGAAAPIAGQDKAAMTDALLAFRAGTKDATVMTRIARGFSDTELSSIAAWWAEQK